MSIGGRFAGRRFGVAFLVVMIASVGGLATGRYPTSVRAAQAHSERLESLPNSAGTHSSDLHFTPNTVVVGRSLVNSRLKSVSANGATFTFSSRTGNIAKLKAGSTMLLQGTAVRRVTDVQFRGAGEVVKTESAGISDLVENGNLSWNTKLKYSSAIVTPMRGQLLTGSQGRHSVRLGSPSIRDAGGLTLSGKVKGYSYEMKFNLEGSNLGLEITLSKKQPVSLSATVSGTLKNFISKGSIAVAHAKVTSAAVTENALSGQMTLGYNLKPGNGLGTGGQYLLSLPGEMRIPIIIDGIPFFIGVKVAYFVGVGFSQKNQSLSGSYTVSYNGSSGFALSKAGATTPTGVMRMLGKILLSNAKAILKGPISLVIGAQIPRLEFGLGVKGASVGAYVNLVASTAVQVGGQSTGSTGGCDARSLRIVTTAGADATLFGLSVGTNPFTLYDKTLNASYPAGCGTVGG